MGSVESRAGLAGAIKGGTLATHRDQSPDHWHPPPNAGLHRGPEANDQARAAHAPPAAGAPDRGVPEYRLDWPGAWEDPGVVQWRRVSAAHLVQAEEWMATWLRWNEAGNREWFDHNCLAFAGRV